MGEFWAPGAEIYDFLRKKIWTVPLILQFDIYMGQVPQDGNFAQNVALFSKK